MRRFAHLLTMVAATLVGGTLIAGTAHAQGPANYYVAVPAAAPAKTTLIARTTVWDRQGDSYVAKRAVSRDAVQCQMLVQRAGALTSFTVAGQAFDADALAKCNAKAKSTGGAVADVAAR